jgi:hypothetical protein
MSYLIVYYMPRIRLPSFTYFFCFLKLFCKDCQFYCFIFTLLLFSVHKYVLLIGQVIRFTMWHLPNFKWFFASCKQKIKTSMQIKFWRNKKFIFFYKKNCLWNWPPLVIIRWTFPFSLLWMLTIELFLLHLRTSLEFFLFHLWVDAESWQNKCFFSAYQTFNAKISHILFDFLKS